MATTVYNDFKHRLASAWVAGKTIKVALLMTGTTAGTQNDGVVFVADITTLDECDSVGYVRQTLANVTVNKDDANDRAELDCDDLNFGALPASTRQIAGVKFIEHIDGTAANDKVIHYAEFDDGPKTPDGSAFDVEIDPEGFLHVKQAA